MKHTVNTNYNLFNFNLSANFKVASLNDRSCSSVLTWNDFYEARIITPFPIYFELDTQKYTRNDNFIGLPFLWSWHFLFEALLDIKECMCLMVMLRHVLLWGLWNEYIINVYNRLGFFMRENEKKYALWVVGRSEENCEVRVDDIFFQCLLANNWL